MAVGDCPLAIREAGSPGRCHQAGTWSSSTTLTAGTGTRGEQEPRQQHRGHGLVSGTACGGLDPPHTPSWLVLLVGVSALDEHSGCAGHRQAAIAPCFWGLTAMGLRRFPLPRDPPQAGAEPPQQSPPVQPQASLPPRIHAAQLPGAGIWLRAHGSLPGGVHYLPGMFNSWGRKKASSGAGGRCRHPPVPGILTFLSPARWRGWDRAPRLHPPRVLGGGAPELSPPPASVLTELLLTRQPFVRADQQCLSEVLNRIKSWKQTHRHAGPARPSPDPPFPPKSALL